MVLVAADVQELTENRLELKQSSESDEQHSGASLFGDLVSFRAFGGRKFHLHRTIVARSSFLSAALSDTGRRRDVDILSSDAPISERAFELALKCEYSSALPADENLEPVRDAAAFLGLDDVTDRVQRRLAETAAHSLMRAVRNAISKLLVLAVSKLKRALELYGFRLLFLLIMALLVFGYYLCWLVGSTRILSAAWLSSPLWLRFVFSRGDQGLERLRLAAILVAAGDANRSSLFRHVCRALD